MRKVPLMVTVTDNQAQTDVPAVIAELNRKFEGQFVVQKTFDAFPTIWVSREQVIEVLLYLRTLPQPYVMLLDISAIDERLRQHRKDRDGNALPDSDFTVFYHLMSLERNTDIRIKVALKEADLHIPTATRIWPNANWYEREAWDMFGITFDGHPHLTRILLPKYWEGHPLRKEYASRATEVPPYYLDKGKQMFEQENLRFVPEEWGMKRSGRDEDFMFLNLGPNHPSAHGAFRVVLQLDGEEVIDCIPDIGYHHRGAEKIAERQTWHSFIPYTDRIDYLGGVMNELPYIMSVEKLAGIQGVHIYNLGAGIGSSVLDVVHAFSKACFIFFVCIKTVLHFFANQTFLDRFDSIFLYWLCHTPIFGEAVAHFGMDRCNAEIFIKVAMKNSGIAETNNPFRPQ